MPMDKTMETSISLRVDFIVLLFDGLKKVYERKDMLF